MRGGRRGIRDSKRTASTKEPQPQGGHPGTRGEAPQRMARGSGHPLRPRQLPFSVLTKGEQVHQVPDGWTIQRNVRIVLADDRIGEIVPAASRHRSQFPIGFDELQDRSVVGVGVRDMSGLGMRRDYQRGYPGTVAKVVERLNVAGVVVTAALVEGNDDGCALPQFPVGLDAVHDFLYEALKQIELRGSRVSGEPAVWLHIGTRGQGAVLNRVIANDSVLRLSPAGRTGHDRAR